MTVGLPSFIIEALKSDRTGIPDDFHLTDHALLKGCGCKVPRNKLYDLLNASLKIGPVKPEDSVVLGIGLDSCIRQVSPDMYLVQTTDFFSPLIDDPYLQGKIAAANVLSDLYAMGVTQIHSVLSILAICRDITNTDLREKVSQLLLKGFVDKIHEAGSVILGGQTIFNPWFLIGGVGTSVVPTSGFIEPWHAKPGQILVLTKPLGTQVAIHAHTWLHLQPQMYRNLKGHVSDNDIRFAYDLAVSSMIRLNRNAAELMQKYRDNIGGCTDITGFGILGHAQNLAQSQKMPVSFIIEVLYVLPCVMQILKHNGERDFKFLEGLSAETSGGLLIAMDSCIVDQFCDQLYVMDGWPAVPIGRVVSGENTALLNTKSIETLNIRENKLSSQPETNLLQ